MKIFTPIKDGNTEMVNSQNIKVLNNNNIVYQREYKLYYDNINKYFLDFYIEIGDRKIDLEIDGNQHNFEDRKYHDKIRDEYIKSQGIEVYRIKWNSINNEKGKQLMKEKIDKFLEYINMGVVQLVNMLHLGCRGQVFESPNPDNKPIRAVGK